MDEKQEFRTYLVALAGMVPGFMLKPEMIALYDEAAQKCGYQKANIALKQIIATRNSRDPFPAIADLISLVEFNGLDAEEIAMKISGAVAKFGNYRAADARIYLGEVAWEIIQIEGGWENVCQMLTYENMPTLQAQWRRVAQILVQRKKASRMTEIGYLKPMGGAIEEGLKKLLESKDKE